MMIRTNRVTKKYFKKKMKYIEKITRNDIKRFIAENRKEVDHYEYGRILEKRDFAVVLKNGTKKIWRTIKPLF